MKNKFRPFYIAALAIAGFALLGSSFVPRAKADDWNKLTVVTVNEPIIAGNKVLAPGTYVWKLMDSSADRHIVQIFDKDQKHLEETVLAIPDYRLQPVGNTRFTFWETPAGVPKAVRAWFFPGDEFGQEFPYNKKLVAQLASAVPVPAVYHPEPVAAPEPTPVAAPEPAPQPAAQPIPEPAPAPAAAPEPQAPAPAAEPAPQTLPHTASNSPVFALLGLISLSSAGLLSLATKKA